MSELLNEEVEAAIDEMVEESIVDTYYRMGQMISELSTKRISAAADEAEKRVRQAEKDSPADQPPSKEKLTRARQAGRFGREADRRTEAKIKRIQQHSATVGERHAATEKAYKDQKKAKAKGSIVRGVKRFAKKVTGAEAKRQKKRYGTEDK